MKCGFLQKLDNLDAEVRSAQAMVLYKNMMGSGCRGGCRKRLSICDNEHLFKRV
jgi:hypothetical protein